MLHVFARYDEVGTEVAGVIVFEAIKKRLLSAAGYYNNGESGSFYLLQHFVGSGHLGGFGTGIEQAALFFVNALHFIGRGIAVPITLGEDVDGGIAGSSFVHIGFLLGHVESELGADFGPGAGMVGHGVEEYAVHVEQYGLGGEGAEALFFQI